MFAVIMGISALGPAMAAKAPKSDVCHFSEEEIDPVTGAITPAQWIIININGNALKAHVDKHTDGTDFDFVIDDNDLDPNNDTSVCEGRNLP